MIKRILFLALSLNIVIHCESEAQASFGVRQGVVFSQVLFDDVDIQFNTDVPQRQKQGNVTGIIFKYFAQPNIGIQAELNIIEKGWIQKLDDGKEFETTLNYLQLPLLTHLYIGKGKFKPILLAGPYFSMLYDSKRSAIQDDQKEQIKFQYSESEDNQYEFGISGGLGLAFDSSIGTFQVDVRFSPGLTNILNKDAEMNPTSSKNQLLEFSASYLFRFSKKDK
ncbi:porin family protein [Fulvivirgaceae bacterium BMA10]|uniref:Porin family protein n=1 Tax=Splendidivirga corallicola TaxID=3051826 RepID=A0ABT8KQ74_9BACT|nr:porin family protein [Fulvivirgaceae bacterium BMA10]